MNAEGHLKRAKEIRRTIEVLKNNENHVSSIVELVYGCALHCLAYGCEKRFGAHSDIHTQLTRFLRERGEDEIAVLFGELDTLRHGRWYGGKGNGETVLKVLEILNAIERWKDES